MNLATEGAEKVYSDNLNLCKNDYDTDLRTEKGVI